MRFNHKQGTLMSRTVKLLRRDTRSLTQISFDAQIPVDWLKRLSSGRLRDPGVNRMQALYEYLTGKQLDV